MPDDGNAAADKGQQGAGAAAKGSEGAGAGASVSKDVMEQIQQVVKSEMGGLIKKQLTGQLEGFLKSEDFTKLIGGKLKEASAPPPPPPTEIDEIKQRAEIIERRLNESEKARKEAEGKARSNALKTGIYDIIASLDGKDGRPKIRDDARADLSVLIQSGHNLPGKPDVDDNGEVVVKLADGVVRPLSDILHNGYFGDSHWALSRFATTGSGGGRGAAGGQSASAVLKGLSSHEDRRQLRELATKDPDAAIAEINRLRDESAARMNSVPARARTPGALKGK